MMLQAWSIYSVVITRCTVTVVHTTRHQCRNEGISWMGLGGRGGGTCAARHLSQVVRTTVHMCQYVPAMNGTAQMPAAVRWAS